MQAPVPAPGMGQPAVAQPPNQPAAAQTVFGKIMGSRPVRYGAPLAGIATTIYAAANTGLASQATLAAAATTLVAAKPESAWSFVKNHTGTTATAIAFSAGYALGGGGYATVAGAVVALVVAVKDYRAQVAAEAELRRTERQRLDKEFQGAMTKLTGSTKEKTPQAKDAIPSVKETGVDVVKFGLANFPSDASMIVTTIAEGNAKGNTVYGFRAENLKPSKEKVKPRTVSVQQVSADGKMQVWISASDYTKITKVEWEDFKKMSLKDVLNMGRNTGYQPRAEIAGIRAQIEVLKKNSEELKARLQQKELEVAAYQEVLFGRKTALTAELNSKANEVQQLVAQLKAGTAHPFTMAGREAYGQSARREPIAPRSGLRRVSVTDEGDE